MRQLYAGNYLLFDDEQPSVRRSVGHVDSVVQLATFADALITGTKATQADIATVSILELDVEGRRGVTVAVALTTTTDLQIDAFRSMSVPKLDMKTVADIAVAGVRGALLPVDIQSAATTETFGFRHTATDVAIHVESDIASKADAVSEPIISPSTPQPKPAFNFMRHAVAVDATVFPFRFDQDVRGYAFTEGVIPAQIRADVFVFDWNGPPVVPYTIYGEVAREPRE